MTKHEAVWAMVQVYSVEPEQQSSPPSLPFQFQQLVDNFQELFEEPKGIPPIRALTHSIPLLSGARPFGLKPYRYTPFKKDEIEKQVTHPL